MTFDENMSPLMLWAFEKSIRHPKKDLFWWMLQKYIENYWLQKVNFNVANISATEARIFMNFYMVVNYYLVGLYFKFHEDSWINARAQVVNVRTHVLSRLRAFTTCVCAVMSWPHQIFQLVLSFSTALPEGRLVVKSRQAP